MLNCQAKEGTARWYYNSLQSLSFSSENKVTLTVMQSNTGFYYCYGYSEKLSTYFLSKNRIEIFCKFFLYVMVISTNNLVIFI